MRGLFKNIWYKNIMVVSSTFRPLRLSEIEVRPTMQLTKAGLQGFTKTLAIELGKFGITTNAVAPGFIETDMTKETAKRLGLSFEEFVHHSVSQIPVGRSGKPFDIAHAVAFFADENSSFINGQVLYVAGGPKN